ncbi:MAG: SDR family NAD(P)-dependent oxidoreductase [Verrucomicrobiales bacterium]|nr:SDR family NAD(P)-dependent oxidoreductase [Verrucomicrobiales bacterium]
MNSTTTERVAWITGAAGGLGSALVSAFAAAGYRVAAAGHSTLPNVELESARVWPMRLDVTRADEVCRAVSQIEQRWGGIDVLVNNAGICADHLLAQMNDAEWDRVLAVNLKGPFLCCREVVPSMIQRRLGHILNVASDVARRGGRGRSNYAASKAGLIGLSLSLAQELGGFGICVNAVIPGFMSTPMTTGLDARRAREFQDASVLGAWVEPVRVARFMVDLAGHSHISGQVLQVDGRVSRWT